MNKRALVKKIYWGIMALVLLVAFICHLKVLKKSEILIFEIITPVNDYRVILDDTRDKNDILEWGNAIFLTVYDESSCRNKNCDVIFGYGYSDVLLKDCVALNRNQKGCILGKGIATKLFGNAESVGQKVEINDECYEVFDVSDEYEDIVYVSMDEEILEKMYQYINIVSVRYPAKNTKAKVIEVQSRSLLSLSPLRYDGLTRISYFFESMPEKWSDFDAVQEKNEARNNELRRMRTASKCIIEDEIYNESIRCVNLYKLFVIGLLCYLIYYLYKKCLRKK